MRRKKEGGGGEEKGLRGAGRMCVIIEPADSVTPVMAVQSK